MIKFLKNQQKKRWLKHYQKKYWPIIIDIALAFIILILLVLFSAFHFLKPLLYAPTIVNTTDNSKYTLDLNNPPLVSEFSWKDKSLNQQDLSAELNLKLNNQSPKTISNLKISFNSQTPGLSIKKIELNGEVLDASSVKISAGFNLEINSLEKNNPQEIPLKIYFSPITVPKTRDVKTEAVVEYNIASQNLKKTVSLDDLLLEASLNVKALGLYTSSEGDQLGLGPIPPIVGQPTNYWLFFEAASSGDLNDFILSSKLPKGVEFLANYSLLAGEFSYNPDSRQILWKIPQIKNQEKNYRLGLEVQIVPTKNQIGQPPILAEKIVYQANDPLTGQELYGTATTIDTNLDADRFNQGSGKVQTE